MYEHGILEMQYNKLQTDFRAEAVAVNLMKYHSSLSLVFVERLGINDRAYLKDIKTITKQYLGFDDEIYNIKTYREGIYDYLPEGIFHPPSLNSKRNNVESVVKEIRRQKKVEDDARKFFRPFELEVFFTEISALLKEQEFDLTSQTDALIKTFSELWPLIKLLDRNSACIFVHILPFLHKIRGDKKLFEQCLSAFLEIPVEVTFQARILEKIEEESNAVFLGNSRLGLDYIPSGRHYDGERNWVVNIGPIPYYRMKDFVEGSRFKKVLTAFYEYCLPLNTDFKENFVTEKQQFSFVLDEEDENQTRLGYSTFL